MTSSATANPETSVTPAEMAPDGLRDEAYHAARADVIAIDLFPERLGHVRHLVRAYGWEE